MINGKPTLRIFDCEMSEFRYTKLESILKLNYSVKKGDSGVSGYYLKKLSHQAKSQEKIYEKQSK